MIVVHLSISDVLKTKYTKNIFKKGII